MKIDHLLANAKSHAKKGEKEAARKLYNRILEKYPENREAKKGLKELHVNVLKGSLSELTQDQINSVISLYSKGQFSDCLNALQILISKYPDQVILYNISGACYAGLVNFESAITSYEKALELNPYDSELHKNMGTVFMDFGHVDAAVESYKKAIKFNPDYVDAHFNLGLLLTQRGELEAAIGSYKQVLKIKTDYVEAFYNIARILSELCQFETAITYYEQTLKLKPNHVEAHFNLGLSLTQLGHLEAATNCYKQAIKINPDHMEAQFNLGNTFKALNHQDAALKCYQQALKVKPNFTEAHNNLGIIQNDLCQIDLAIESFKQAIQIKPDFAEAHNNLGNTYKGLNQLNLAVLCYKEALSIDPYFTQVHDNLGGVFRELRKFSEAKKCHEKALELEPDFASAYNNLGLVYAEMGQLEMAIDSHKRALALNPHSADFRWNFSLLQIENDFIPEGFKNYESRWERKKLTSQRRQFSMPRWVGESLLGKNILIWAEQGIGDEFQFSTLIPEFEKLGCKVGIECSAKVVEIFQWSFPWLEVQEIGELHCESSEVYSQFDYQIPMGSLAGIFRKSLDDFRTRQKPYIPRLKEGEQKVRDKLKLEEGQLLIGLSWRSSIPSFHDLSVEYLAPLATIKGAVFLAVQYDDCLPELDRLRALGLSVHYYTDIDQKNDLASACALLGACDLVISASTSVFQQSGGLGIPTLMFDPSKCKYKRIPWHPTVRFLELNPDDPPLLIEQILSEVPEIINWVNQVTTSARRVNPYKK